MAVPCWNHSTPDCCDLFLIICITSAWWQSSSLWGTKEEKKAGLEREKEGKKCLRTVYLWKTRWGGRVGGGGGSCYRLWCFIHFTGSCMWRQTWTCTDREEKEMFTLLRAHKTPMPTHWEWFATSQRQHSKVTNYKIITKIFFLQ